MGSSPAVFTFPNRILFGEGARSELARELARLGVRRPLIVTDPGLVATGLPDTVAAGLSEAVVFSAVKPNPDEADCLAGLDRYRRGNCDGLVALGGGSPIDAAKAIRLLATHAGRLSDYDLTAGGVDRITPDLPPLAALPTTAGTGSEAARGAVLQLPGAGRKVVVLSPHLLPSVALCDPELTYGLPSVLTAATGLDALTHAIEGYLSTAFHPICDGIALEALRHLARGLESAVRDGSDRAARRSVMLGALLAGIAFHKGLGVVHALAHALGGEGRAHHGTLNAILLPHALRLNREAAEPKLADLAATLGLGRSGDGAGHFITLVDLLLIRMPLPRRLGEVEGLRRDRLAEYAAAATLDHCLRTNPRPCSASDLEALLERAW